MAAPGPRHDRCARRPARLHGLEQADPDRLGRLPGVLARRPAQDHRGRRHVRVADQRRQAVPVAGSVDADPEGAELRHRDAVRRMHAVRDQRRADDAQGSGRLDAHVAALGEALARRVRPARQPERPLRDRPGRDVRGSARRIARGAVRARLPRPRDRRAIGRRAEGRHDARAAARRPEAAGQQAALPDGRRHAGRPDRGRRERHRHVRLRDADPQRAQRLAVHALRRREDPQRDAQELAEAARCELRLLYVPELLARLPASPAPCRRNPRRAAQHDPQPALLPAADGRDPRRDRNPYVRRVPPALRGGSCERGRLTRPAARAAARPAARAGACHIGHVLNNAFQVPVATAKHYNCLSKQVATVRVHALTA
ncbi:LigA [Burkholderia ambifaria]